MYRAVISYNGAGREGGKEGAECSVGVGHGSVFSFPGFWGIGGVWSFWPHLDSTLCIGFNIIRLSPPESMLHDVLLHIVVVSSMI